MNLRISCIVALSGLLAACGSSDDGAGKAASGGSAGSAGTGGSAGLGGGGGSAGTPATGGSAGTPAATGCGNAAVPQSGKRTISVGGTERTYTLHVPTGYDPAKPWPLVVNFHGRTLASLGEASVLQESVSHLNAKGDAAGFIVVNPQGLTDSDNYQTWNGGLCCAEDKNRDDVGFVDAMLDSLESELCVDEKRVYAAGLSNGGIMSYRLACERAGRFAAIAPVAGMNGMLTCSPSRPVSVIAFHGTADSIVSYDNLGKPAVDGWVTRNGCNPTPTETYNNGDSHCDTYSGCQDGAEVVLCTIQDGGHTWPGGMDLSAFGFGKTTQDLSANDALWDFFVKHPLP